MKGELGEYVFSYIDENGNPQTMTWNPLIEETEESWWYATQYFELIIGVFKWLFPSYFTLFKRAFGIWRRKAIGNDQFHCPPCMNFAQRMKISMYLLIDPSDEKLAEFVQQLLDGTAHEWTPDK